MAASRFLEACARRPVDATPVWFMRQAGRYMAEYRALRKRYSILELCERPELAAEVTLQPVRRFGVDAAILFADILLPARPLGLKLDFVRGEGPALSPPIRARRDVERLRDFDPRQGLPYVLEAVRIVRRELAATSGGRVALIGFAGAPFTLASYLVEGGSSGHYFETKRMMYQDPKTWRALMEKLSRVTARYLEAQIEAGAQAVQLFDSWVGALSAADYRRFVLPYSRYVLESLRACKVPTIHFGTGTSGFLEEFREAGGDVIGVDWRIPLGRAWKKIGYGRAIQGNLDPVVLACGSGSELRDAVRAVLKEAAGRAGHIFNLGHGILPQTPVENVEAVVGWVRKYGAA
ncbi:MAG: uroporphyrinogen decarboxylase [Elusimicrobia bacterium]|nr:uroporphyrinogen decarboxylase [Elusimicrobiota bacterium]